MQRTGQLRPFSCSHIHTEESQRGVSGMGEVRRERGQSGRSGGGWCAQLVGQ